MFLTEEDPKDSVYFDVVEVEQSILHSLASGSKLITTTQFTKALRRRHKIELLIRFEKLVLSNNITFIKDMLLSYIYQNLLMVTSAV